MPLPSAGCDALRIASTAGWDVKTKLRAVRFSESEEYAIGRYAREFGLAFSDVERRAAEAFLARSA